MKWKSRGAGGPLASAPMLFWYRDDEHPGFIPSDNRGRGSRGREQTRSVERQRLKKRQERKKE